MGTKPFWRVSLILNTWVVLLGLLGLPFEVRAQPITSDFNGDGFADLAIGVPGEDVGAIFNAGAVNVLYGSAAGLSAAGSQFGHQGILDIPGDLEAGDFVGFALAAQ